MDTKNNYTTVRSWRDSVSESLGSLKTGVSSIEKKLDTVCAKQTEYEKRIKNLETIESNRKAISRAMNALIGAIGGIIALLGDKIWAAIK